LKSIPSRCFGNCTSLTSVTIPDGVTTIDSYAFYYCSSLAKINFPESINTINQSAFNSCTSLDNVDLKGVKTINQEAFSGCSSLTNLTLSDNLKTVYGSAFRYCDNLKQVVIPDSVKTIEENAFGYGNYSSTNQNYLVEDFVIYGTVGSEAETYATNNDITFVDVATGKVPTPTTPDDNTSEIDASNFVNGVYCDVNNDGVANILDLLTVKKYLLGIIK
jgi:hypothetical protein